MTNILHRLLMASLTLGVGFAANSANAIDVAGNPSFRIVDETNGNRSLGPCTVLQDAGGRSLIKTESQPSAFGGDVYFMGITNAAGTLTTANNNQVLPVSNRRSTLFQNDRPLQGFYNPAFPDFRTMTVIDYLEDGSSQIVFQQQLTDAEIAAAPAACQAQAANNPPVADAGPDRLRVAAATTVTLDGTASSDPDNDPLTYAWTQLSGPNVTLSDATAARPTFTAPSGPQTGPIVFQLVVNDGTDDSAPDSVSITINNGPAANAGADQIDLAPGSQVRLDGTASSDPENDPLTYAWTQVSGPSVSLDDPTSATPSFTAPRESGGQPIVFQLVVSDGTLFSAPDTVSIDVIDNVEKTTALIRDMIDARNALILTHQPDRQRRIDRLQGRVDTGNAVISGMQVSDAPLPGSVEMRDGRTDISTSLSQARSEAGRFDVWGEAHLSNVELGGRDADFDIYYIGADMRVGRDTLLGVMAQFDDLGFDAVAPAGNDFALGALGGTGWMIGPYLTHRLDDGLFLDARAAFGSSDNDLSPFGTYTDSFETSRFLVSAALTGEMRLDERWTLRPEAGIDYVTAQSESYTDGLGSLIPDVERDMGQLHIGSRLHRRGEHFAPFLDANGIYSFGDGVDRILGSETRLRIEAGTDVFFGNGVRGAISVFKDGIGADRYDSEGIRFNLGFTFD